MLNIHILGLPLGTVPPSPTPQLQAGIFWPLRIVPPSTMHQLHAGICWPLRTVPPLSYPSATCRYMLVPGYNAPPQLPLSCLQVFAGPQVQCRHEGSQLAKLTLAVVRLGQPISKQLTCLQIVSKSSHRKPPRHTLFMLKM